MANFDGLKFTPAFQIISYTKNGKKETNYLFLRMVMTNFDDLIDCDVILHEIEVASYPFCFSYKYLMFKSDVILH